MPTVTYRNLKFWDGVSETLSDANDLTISGSTISSFNAGPDSTHRDAAGLYAIPGLIDAHIHLCLNPEIKDPFEQTRMSNEAILGEMRDRSRTMVEAGITTARDLGGGAYLELRIRDEIMEREIAGPRLICSGQPITSIGGHCHFWGGEAADTAEALTVLEKQHNKGVDLIKVMVTGGNITPGSKPVDSQFEDETLEAIVSCANGHGYHVAAHCHGTRGIGQAAAAGVTTVEHCSWVGKDGWGKAYDASIAKAIADQGVFVSPTINTGWERLKKNKEFVSMIQENYTGMKEAGVQLIASTDAGIPNVKHHDLPRALPVFAHFAGLSNLEVLKSATSDCARAIGLGEVTGRIEPGLEADLVLFEANPLDDLEVLLNPVQVISRGQEMLPV